MQLVHVYICTKFELHVVRTLYLFLYCCRPHLSDSGITDVTINSVDMSITVLLGDNLSIKDCSLDIGPVDVNLEGGARYMYMYNITSQHYLYTLVNTLIYGLIDPMSVLYTFPYRIRHIFLLYHYNNANGCVQCMIVFPSVCNSWLYNLFTGTVVDSVKSSLQEQV